MAEKWKSSLTLCFGSNEEVLIHTSPSFVERKEQVRTQFSVKYLSFVDSATHTAETCDGWCVNGVHFAKLVRASALKDLSECFSLVRR